MTDDLENRDGMDVAVAALRVLARTHADLLADALREAQPWIAWFPAEDQVACVRELTDDLASGVSADGWACFLDDLVAWRHTAEVWADPALAERLQADLVGDAGRVHRQPAS